MEILSLLNRFFRPRGEGKREVKAANKYVTIISDWEELMATATSRKSVDLRKVLARYANCWIALSSDEQHVVATAKHPKQAASKAHAKGENDPVLMWAPKEHNAYVV